MAQSSAWAQTENDVQLAQYYYLKGEFDKAQIYYETIYESNPSKVYFNRYVECLVKGKDFKTVEKVFKKQTNLNPQDISLKIEFCFFYQSINAPDKAKKIKNEVNKLDVFDPKMVEEVLNMLLLNEELDWAKDWVDHSKKNIRRYPTEIWDSKIYKAQGQTAKYLESYLMAVSKSPDLEEALQIELSNQYDFSKDSPEVKELKNVFLQAAQKDPNNMLYTEMLIWFFSQSKNFPAALVQVSALEKRYEGDGSHLIDFSEICLQNEDYATAKKALMLVVDGQLFRYKEAQKRYLSTGFQELTQKRKFSQIEIDELSAAYGKYTKENQGADPSPQVFLEYATILAYYSNQPSTAIATLQQTLKKNRYTDIQKATLKLKLADVLVLMDSIWEASILYMQIDSDFKFEPVGNEAKFKNARIFYYDGEFEYAQSQLDVLKESTSKFISNDAMQLSLLITENYGLDSNYQSMYWFARSELLVEQHRYAEAFVYLDSISSGFLTSSLNDDILYVKGRAFQAQGEWAEACSYFEKLNKAYHQEILADDALYQLAKINQGPLNLPEKAAEYFLMLITDYPNSLYLDEARTQIRKLRGDSILEER